MLLCVCRQVCQRSLMQQQLTLDLLEELGKSLNPQPRMANEETYYCELCEVGTKYLKINKLNPQPRMANNENLLL